MPTTLAVKKTQRLPKDTEWSDDPTPLVRAPSDYPMPYAKKRINDSKWLVQLGGLYIWLPPAILELPEFRETLYTLKNTSKPTQVLSDQIFRFSTSFVNESARIAQV